jgi:hypothetical protein
VNANTVLLALRTVPDDGILQLQRSRGMPQRMHANQIAVDEARVIACLRAVPEWSQLPLSLCELSGIRTCARRTPPLHAQLPSYSTTTEQPLASRESRPRLLFTAPVPSMTYQS